MRNLIFILLSIPLLFTAARAQTFGGNPPSLKLKQVNSATAKVIYPAGLDSTARRVASITSLLQQKTTASIGSRFKPVSIVLQNQTLVSNGYVSIGPYRSEFYLTPSQNSFELGSLPWPDQLTIHEFRHVQQYNNFDIGLSHVFRILFGQQGQILANDLVIPNWFWEGDAVFNETQTSLQGRGRIPAFFNAYRSLWQANKNYSWMKLRNGSYRDFVPDHYALGYLMTAYGREKYGETFWKQVTHDAASFKGVFYPFQKAVKKYSGNTYPQFRTGALQYMRQQLAANAITTNEPKHFAGDKEYPAITSNSNTLYAGSSYKQIHQFTLNENGKEQKLRTMDVTLDNYFSTRNGKIVYASYRPDIRWGYRNYNEIQIVDVATGKQETITHKTKYFSPDISSDGNSIVAVQVLPNEKNTLHVIDAATGQVKNTIANPENIYYTYPKFLNDHQVVTAVRNHTGQMALMMVDLNSGVHETLIPFAWRIIGFPQVSSDTIYFSASHHGKDELFAYTIPNKNIYKLEHTELDRVTGNYQPAANAGKFAWTNFTAAGMRLNEVNEKELTWQPVTKDFNDASVYNFGIHALTNENASDLLQQVSDSAYLATKYRKSTRLFNFHSWRPIIDDPDYYFSLIGENVINTMQSELYFRYNTNEQYKQFGFNATYGALFPFLQAGVSYTIDRNAYDYTNKRYAYWNEFEASAGLSVPLNLSKGRSTTRLSASSLYTYNQSYFKGAYKAAMGNPYYAYLNNTISFSHQIQQAPQHIYPRLAQTLTLNYKAAIQQLEGQQFLAATSLYWPGLFTNHNFVVSLAYQVHDTLRQISYSNNFPFARGYSSVNASQMYKASANYTLPLVYPDWGFAGIVYFMRVRTNLFFDYTHTSYYNNIHQKINNQFRSAGSEVFFDTKWWNQLPVSFGIRYSRLLNDDIFGYSGHNRWEFVLPVNLLGR